MNTLRRYIKNKRGNTHILVVMALSVMMGFSALVIDVGLMFIERSRLVNAVDAAVLAGAQELVNSSTNTFNIANEYINQNTDDVSNISININESNSSIGVKIDKSLDLIFGKVIGFDKATIVADAKAMIGPVTEVYDGIRPLVVENQSLIFGSQVTLKEDAGDGQQGNYGVVSLGGTGSKVYENNIKYGYNGTLKVGDLIDTETGNMSGATYDGVNYITTTDNSTFSNYKRDSLRIWTIPIVNTLNVSGKKSVEIIGFAAFFVEDTKKKSGKTEIIGRFIEFVANGKIDQNQTNYGLKGVKLIN